MNSDFPMIISMLRRERRLSQKQVAADLGISQALLSHYEKGIRECGLDFLVKAAEYYDVSCDYLLGRTPNRNGQQAQPVNIPDAAVLRSDGILHQQPVAFRAEHLNPAVGADPRASLRTADASAVRRGIHCVGLPRRKRHYLGVQRSLRNFRCTSSIRQGSSKTGQQRKQERHEFLHFHQSKRGRRIALPSLSKSRCSTAS